MTKIGDTVQIGHPMITQPNAEGMVVGITDKQITVEITKRIYKPKTSGTGIKHTFIKGEKEWYNQTIGRKFKFWKETGKQLPAGRFFIIKK